MNFLSLRSDAIFRRGPNLILLIIFLSWVEHNVDVELTFTVILFDWLRDQRKKVRDLRLPTLQSWGKLLLMLYFAFLHSRSCGYYVFPTLVHCIFDGVHNFIRLHLFAPKNQLRSSLGRKTRERDVLTELNKILEREPLPENSNRLLSALIVIDSYVPLVAKIYEVLERRLFLGRNVDNFNHGRPRFFWLWLFLMYRDRNMG